jgi:hypothetical protein
MVGFACSAEHCRVLLIHSVSQTLAQGVPTCLNVCFSVVLAGFARFKCVSRLAVGNFCSITVDRLAITTPKTFGRLHPYYLALKTFPKTYSQG